MSPWDLQPVTEHGKDWIVCPCFRLDHHERRSSYKTFIPELGMLILVLEFLSCSRISSKGGVICNSVYLPHICFVAFRVFTLCSIIPP